MKSAPNELRLLAILALLILIIVPNSSCVRDNYAGTNDCKFGAAKASATSVADGLGVNIHFTNPRPGEMKMLADAGVRWVRMDLKWDATERERGQYDFSEYDPLLAALEPYNTHALLILDYGNPLYEKGGPPRTETSRQAFARWATAAAKHFAGRGVIWEIYNEPNHDQFWPPRPNVDEYVALALAVGRAFRAEVPGEKLIGPATSGIDFQFLEACFKGGLLDYWSAVSVHPYLRSDPEDVANDYCRLRKMIASYAPVRTRSSGVGLTTNSEIPIVSGEWGYSSVWPGMTDEKQGEMLAREMLTNVANGIPISIWYDWQDDGLDPNEPEHHFGLVGNSYQLRGRQVYEPKPAFFASQTLSTLFNGYRFEERLAIGGNDDYVLAFGNGSDTRFAAWTTSSTPHHVLIPVGDGRFGLTKHTGENLPSAVSKQQSLAIDISSAPVYVTSLKQIERAHQ